MAGTNDCMNSRRLVPLPQYEQNMRSIISSIVESKSRMILMSILPAYETYLNIRHDPKAYKPLGHIKWKNAVNELIEKLAKEYLQIFLDMHHIFITVGNIGEESDSLLRNEINSGVKDGVHPTPEGYRVMAIAIYECIIQNNLSHQKIVCLGDSITAGKYPVYLEKMI
jgi:lysophospholipase L1-like esterase